MVKFALILSLVLVAVQAQHQQQGPPPAPPQINWGKCSQLQPTDSDKNQKRKVIEDCLSQHPAPPQDQLNAKTVEEHREKITTCALQAEGWFDDSQRYKFDRARSEIVSKKLSSDVEGVVLQKHDDCKKEAESKFPNGYTDQVKFYQACMDYHISETCGIHIILPPEHQHRQGQGQGPPPRGLPQQQFRQHEG